jgi:hypothetical protein
MYRTNCTSCSENFFDDKSNPESRKLDREFGKYPSIRQGYWNLSRVAYLLRHSVRHINYPQTIRELVEVRVLHWTLEEPKLLYLFAVRKKKKEHKVEKLSGDSMQISFAIGTGTSYLPLRFNNGLTRNNGFKLRPASAGPQP